MVVFGGARLAKQPDPRAPRRRVPPHRPPGRARRRPAADARPPGAAALRDGQQHRLRGRLLRPGPATARGRGPGLGLGAELVGEGGQRSDFRLQRAGEP
jgi:hypothetical protein